MRHEMHSPEVPTGNNQVLQVRLGGWNEQACLYQADLGVVGTMYLDDDGTRNLP